MSFIFFRNTTGRIRRKTQKHLETYSKPSIDFFVLIACASALISLGLLLDNTAIVIGGMVVAPLITPFFGFSLNFLLLKPWGMLRALLSIFLGTTLAIAIAFVIGQLTILLYNKDSILTSEIMSRTQPDTLYFLVAVISGLVGTFAYGKKELTEKVVGIAISAAIVPPLAVAGLALAIDNINFFSQSTLLFFINMIGIFIGSIIMFLLLGFGKDIQEIN